MNTTGVNFSHVSKKSMRHHVHTMLYNLGTKETELLGYDTFFMQKSLKKYLQKLIVKLSKINVNAMLTKSLKRHNPSKVDGGSRAGNTMRKQNQNGNVQRNKTRKNNGGKKLQKNVKGLNNKTNTNVNNNVLKMVNGTIPVDNQMKIRRRANNNKLTRGDKNKVE